MLAGESDERNKSELAAEPFIEKKGVAAGRAGRDQDIAQAVLMFATNYYCYGQVGFQGTLVDAVLTTVLQTLAVDGGYLLESP